jgi:predicted kinase
MNKVIIMRGNQGSGKSTYAKANYPGAIICSADNYMVNHLGDYHFNPMNLSIAHGNCKNAFMQALELKAQTVVVDNTNIAPSWFKEYVEAAARHGYEVEIVRVLCAPEIAHQRNKHGVPFETVKLAYEKLSSQPMLENEKLILTEGA